MNMIDDVTIVIPWTDGTTVVLPWISFLLFGFALALLVIRPRPSSLSVEEVDALRRALSTWAERYIEARPTGRHVKRRDVELLAACKRVGLPASRRKCGPS